MSFGEVIRDIRERRKQTGIQFASSLGYGSNNGHVSRLERDIRDPTLEFVRRLMQVATEEEQRRILLELGVDQELDQLAIDVHHAMQELPWSPHRKAAFRATVRTMIRTAT